MTEIAFDPSISSDMQAQIITKLRGIEERENVRILFAIESGSRAWGFPLPDSDYDARFVYTHNVDWYLSISPGRDVIELPIEGELDINGWDIKKALGLLLKPNPVLLEWLSSPVRYIWNEHICEELIKFSKKTTHGPACLNHYLHLGHWDVYVDGKERVNLKKYFYIVRPVMAVRWIRLNPDLAPPMNFQELLGGVDLPTGLSNELHDLLLRKSRSKELGEAARISIVDEFIRAEFDWAREAVGEMSTSGVDLTEEANHLFRSIVMGTS